MLPPFPWYLNFAILAAVFWPVTLLVATLLAALGYWFQRRFMRWALWSVAGLLALLLLSAAGMILWTRLSEAKRDHDEAADIKRRTAVLAAPAVTAHGTLPAGTKVLWTDNAHQDFVWVELPQTTTLLGVDWQEYLEHDRGTDYWDGKLAHEQQIGPYRCRAGEIHLTLEEPNIPEDCILAANVTMAGQVFPAGSHLKHIESTVFEAPPDGLLLQATNIKLLGGDEVSIGSEVVNKGRISLVELHNPTTFRGVPLSNSFLYSYTEDGRLLGVYVTLLPGQTLHCDRQTLTELTSFILLLQGDAAILTEPDGAPSENRVPGCIHGPAVKATR